jgi:hypothetical protein
MTAGASFELRNSSNAPKVIASRQTLPIASPVFNDHHLSRNAYHPPPQRQLTRQMTQSPHSSGSPQQGKSMETYKFTMKQYQLCEGIQNIFVDEGMSQHFLNPGTKPKLHANTSASPTVTSASASSDLDCGYSTGGGRPALSIRVNFNMQSYHSSHHASVVSLQGPGLSAMASVGSHLSSLGTPSKKQGKRLS